MAWAQVKGHIKANTKEFNLTEVEQLAWQGFGVVTATRWSKLIKHVEEKVEDHYWECEGLHRRFVDRFIIEFGKGDSDSDDPSNDESTDGTFTDESTETCCTNCSCSDEGDVSCSDE